MTIVSAERCRALFVESDMDDPAVLEMTAGRVVALSRRCPGKVEPNDDSAAAVETESGAIVMAVADGVGGSPLGYKASAIAVQSIVEGVEAATSDDLRPAILDAIERSNREILDLGAGAATTLSVVQIQGRQARAYQVGDCVTLIVGQRGALKWKSTAHSPVGYGVESGYLDEVAAMNHEDRHLVSNVVGSTGMHIEIGPVRPLARHDTVLIGSDGLFDNLHVAEVIELSKNGPPLRRLERLAECVSRRMRRGEGELAGKPDDLTVLMYVGKA